MIITLLLDKFSLFGWQDTTLLIFLLPHFLSVSFPGCFFSPWISHYCWGLELNLWILFFCICSLIVIPSSFMPLYNQYANGSQTGICIQIFLTPHSCNCSILQVHKELIDDSLFHLIVLIPFSHCFTPKPWSHSWDFFFLYLHSIYQ